MNTMLVRPKFSSIIANLEPLGLEYIAGMLSDMQHRCEIHDEFQMPALFRYRRLTDRIKSGGFDCVGFHANANTTGYILDTAKRLKRQFPNIFILVGGPEAELNYRDFMTDEIDFVYHDNGLDSLRNCFAAGFAPETMEEQTGICFRRGGAWVVREKGPPVSGFLATPDRTMLYQNIKRNFIFSKGSFAIVKASFSCPYDCSFCYCTKMNGGKYTERDLSDVIDEIAGIRHDRIWLVDDTFLVNRERVAAFCEELLRRGIKKQFMAYSRADFLADNPDILPLLRRAGFVDILVGLEAVDDDLLDEYNKKTSRRMNEAAVRHLRESGIVCNALFVVSHKATRGDFRALLRFIRDNRLLWVVFGIFTPYKGTDAYTEYQDRLFRFQTKRLDGLHITIAPEHMSKFMFMVRVYLLYARTYPKIAFRAWRKTAYDTMQFGWFR